ncbi:MAG TPA: tetratricopeptide repeat protein, partial [bacterium]
MKFWLISGAVYLGFLLGHLLLPVAALWNRQGFTVFTGILVVLTALAIFLSTFMVCLMAGKLLFPQYWWMGQVLGQDIFEFDGVYFVGVRLSRVPTRIQRILFNADERFRWWDLMFGLMFLVVLVPHVLLTLTVYRKADSVIPRRIQFPETLHASTLSALPLMKEWQVKWSNDGVLAARLHQELELLNSKGIKTDPDWFRLAQTELLLAFQPRKSVLEPYAFSPSDRVYFDRGRGARATTILRRLITASDAARSPYRADAMILVGFFHLSDYNFGKAAGMFMDAMNAVSSRADSQIPRPLLQLLAAHSTALAGDTATARRLMEAQLADEGLSPAFQALTLEHLADILRMQGNYGAAQQFLDKALAAHRKQKDAMGIARISMYRAAIYLDQHQLVAASQEISKASSEAADGDDL